MANSSDSNNFSVIQYASAAAESSTQSLAIRPSQMHTKIPEVRCVFDWKSQQLRYNNINPLRLFRKPPKGPKVAGQRGPFIIRRKSVIVRNPTVKMRPPTSSKEFADIIGRLALRKYDEIIKNHHRYEAYSSLAAIVMISDTAEPKVISIGTGSIAVMDPFFLRTTDGLNDSHAEVLARRGLMSFLYAELERWPSHDSILELPQGGTRFRLRADVEFHLYVSKTPCGDARIYGSRSTTSPARGCLRAKAGARIVAMHKMYDSNRALTMSCSDKILRWNVLGLQGALLSSLIEPIYLESVVLGNEMPRSALDRALNTRIRNIVRDLPAPYRMNEVSLATTSFKDPGVFPPPTFCVNWSVDREETEIIDGYSGKPEEQPSRASMLSKRIFFLKYLNFFVGGSKMAPKMTYAEAKAKVVDYQQAKEAFFQALDRANFGTWIQKSNEFEYFY